METNAIKLALLVLIISAFYHAIFDKEEGCFLLDFVMGAIKGAAWVAVVGAVIWAILFIISA
jgi:hypothetical protein